jgi:hypothetical protein
MKLIFALAGMLGLAVVTARAQTPVTVTVDTKARGYTIPPDFIGVSIFTATQARDHRGVPGNLFSGTNSQLITIFKNAGIHHLRLGATGSPTSDSPNLVHADIDALFAFAKATGIKVIYSLHYAQGPETAKYVWDNYRQYVDYFAFDNEPDGRLNETNGSERISYFTSWKEFAQSVTNAVPGAKFAGPDAAGRTLVVKFVKKEMDSGCLALITQHTYVGGNPIKKHIDRPHAIDQMLSREWVEKNYPDLYKVMKPLAKENLPFRITELDDYVHGVTNASDAFCSALWALDATHWWAEHGAAGVNLQNTEWLHTDTFHLDEDTNYQIYPKAYGIRAFEEGSHGSVEPVEQTEPDRLRSRRCGECVCDHRQQRARRRGQRCGSEHQAGWFCSGQRGGDVSLIAKRRRRRDERHDFRRWNDHQQRAVARRMDKVEITRERSLLGQRAGHVGGGGEDCGKRELRADSS